MKFMLNLSPNCKRDAIEHCSNLLLLSFYFPPQQSVLLLVVVVFVAVVDFVVFVVEVDNSIIINIILCQSVSQLVSQASQVIECK